MINITFLDFSFRVKKRLPVDLENITNIQNLAQTYEYPCAMFPCEVISDNVLYRTNTTTSNLEYINSWTSEIYSDIYTSQELAIINLYIVARTENPFTLSTSLMTLIEPHIEETYEKEEIQFLLDELLYFYVGTLLYNDSTAQETINTIVSHLREIEADHNSFERIWTKKVDDD